MNKIMIIIVIVCFTFSLFGSELLFALEVQSSQKRIAVLNLLALDDLVQEEANLYTKRLIREINDNPNYESLPQDEIENALVANNIDVSSCSSFECGIQAGQALGVPFIVNGSLSKIDTIFLIYLHVIDVQKKQIINTLSEEFRGGEVEFFDFLATLVPKLSIMPETAEEPPADPILQQILDQQPKNIEDIDQPQTVTIPQESRQVPTQNQTIRQKSSSKWKVFGLLVLAGAGAAVYFLKSQDDDENTKKTNGDPTIASPLPTPPTFPKK